MDTKHLVDPELAPALAMMPNFAFSAEILPVLRDQLKGSAMQRIEATAGDDIVYEERHLPGPEGSPDVRVFLVSPKDPPAGLRAGYVHMHGGGYVMGCAEMSVPYAHQIARGTGATVISVDYRLAPETSFPGPVEDCYAALVWLYRNAAEFGIDTSRIAIGGDSAGGGLAAALGLLSRDRGEVPVCFQVLNYPMTDDRTSAGDDLHPYAGEFIWDNQANQFGWAAMLGQAPGLESLPHHAAASRAEDLTGLPPTFISVGALDLFVEENIEFARRLLRAGVPTELHVYPGAFHGFDLMVESAEVSKRYRRGIVEALTAALRRK